MGAYSEERALEVESVVLSEMGKFLEYPSRHDSLKKRTLAYDGVFLKPGCGKVYAEIKERSAKYLPKIESEGFWVEASKVSRIGKYLGKGDSLVFIFVVNNTAYCFAPTKDTPTVNRKVRASQCYKTETEFKEVDFLVFTMEEVILKHELKGLRANE